jgi:uncharacterized protein YbjT (DUF2867 family)
LPHFQRREVNRGNIVTSNFPTILVVGAAGPSAGLVVPALARRGAKVRGFVRDKAQGDAVRAHGAADIAVGDLRDRASLDAALSGIESVFYIAPAFQRDEVDLGLTMVTAAKAAGVSRIVFSSVIHPTLSSLANHFAKTPVEEAILASNIGYVFLHPAMFFQNLAASWPKVAATGTFAEPWSMDTRFSRVDYRDVAEVAALALTTDRLTFGTFELCAEGNFDRRDVAAIMAEVLGRPVAAAVSEQGDAPREMRAMFDWYDSHGLLGNDVVLRALLGREPRSLRSYFEELADKPLPPAQRSHHAVKVAATRTVADQTPSQPSS